MKKNIGVALLSIIILNACDQIKDRTGQEKDKILNRIGQKIEEKTRDLTPEEEENADAIYIAIRDKDIKTIQKLVEPKLYKEIEQDETGLLELSSYIPYYDPLLTKKRIKFGNQYLIGEGHLLIATYIYDYGKVKNSYTVIFRADQKSQNIAGINIEHDY